MHNKQTSARTELSSIVVHHVDHDRTSGFSVIDLGDSEILRGQNGWNIVLTQTAEVLIRQKIAAQVAQHVRTTPGSTSDTLTRLVQLCQNSNEFCLENNSFAKLSQHYLAQKSFQPQKSASSTKGFR